MTDTPQAPSELARRDNGTVARPSKGFKEYVMDRAAEDANMQGELHAVTAAMLDSMLGATTIEKIMAADMNTPYESRDLHNVRLEIPPQTFRYAYSSDEFSAPLGVYIQFTATVLEDRDDEVPNLSAGEQIIVSSGAPLIIGKLRTLEANELLPVKVQIQPVRTPNGTALKLRWLRPKEQAL